MKPLTVYVDTSVFGGCFDAEFEAQSRRFFDLVRAGRVVVMVSPVVLDELREAPPPSSLGTSDTSFASIRCGRTIR